MGQELTLEQTEELYELIAKFLTDNNVSVESADMALSGFIAMAYAYKEACNPRQAEFVTLEDAAKLLSEGV